MIYVIDHVGREKYEIYGVIGFRRYEYISLNEAKKRYLLEANGGKTICTNSY